MMHPVYTKEALDTDVGWFRYNVWYESNDTTNIGLN
jgi:hypothetical protein